MVALKHTPKACDESTTDKTLFARIADDIEKQGFSVCPGALSDDIANALFTCQQALNGCDYLNAGIGRRKGYLKSELVRKDEIVWITDKLSGGSLWLDWASRLQVFLNQRLFLGLFSFESHFSHYSPGDYYKRHYDAFRGEANRVISIVTYLNPGWSAGDCGELVLYRDDLDQVGLKIIPSYGTIVVFLSEEFPHEVLPATRDRYSVAGWFRVNASIHNRIDPPF